MADANPKSGGLWFRPSLSRITFIVWLAWLSGVVLMWGMHRFQVMHPHFLPVTTLLVIQVIGGLALLPAGLWRIVRGSQRARAFSWLLLGTTPIWLWAAHISYGMWVGHSRSVPWYPGPVVKLAVNRHLEIEYGPTYAGVPVVRAIRSEFETSDNSRYVQVICIPRCDFVPTPEKEFTLAAFDVAPPGRRAWLDRIGVPWHVIVTWSGAAISLVLGKGVQGRQLLRNRQSILKRKK